MDYGLWIIQIKMIK